MFQKVLLDYSVIRIFPNVHSSEEVTKILKASLGRPLMIVKLLDKEVQEYHQYIEKKLLLSTKLWQ